MAKEHSFDIVSVLDMQELDNAVNQTTREIHVRYDLKNTNSKVVLDKNTKQVHVAAADEYRLKSVVDVLQSKVIKRGISLKALKYQKVVPSLGGAVSLNIDVVDGLSSEKAREVAKVIRDTKLKAKGQVEGEKVKVSSPSKDVLQQLIKVFKEKDFDIPLQFVNYR